MPTWSYSVLARRSHCLYTSQEATSSTGLMVKLNTTGQGNAGQKITLNAGQKFILNGGQEITLNTGQKITLNADQKITLNDGQEITLKELRSDLTE